LPLCPPSHPGSLPRLALQVVSLRSASSSLPADYLVVLVGDMVTEEALPSYMNMLNTLDGTRWAAAAAASVAPTVTMSAVLVLHVGVEGVCV
jgi:hypothetical protein